MRKSALILMIILGLVLVGCGQEETDSELDVPDEVVQEEEEREPVILDADVPDRDPFASGGSGSWERERSQVERDGRDPFAVAGSSDWERENGAVDRSGRDPFAPGAEEEEEPVEPPEEPVDPVDPEDPDDPDDPDDVVIDGMVTVQLRTLDRCWLDVFVDDTRVLRTNVPRGETMEWEGSVVRLEQVGREFAVSVVVNGEDLGRLGDLVERLEDGPVIEAGVQISLEQRYAGGVLVGLEFASLAD
ncbi:DUF4115 domain-containing protein [Dethiobacter alkaliphilus]|uniref:DUF4115 domain-containing protein n=1 Tax=Dethiobacter alkaliphilus TaxID=427926 RepID=UPI002227CE12|nr:DUF4115 domain-containing protein [Dethiobacter alkaliphilus]MCW3490294.1 DUF4115 domain-containing protein [Dethiobacter alkaliphilus]